MQQILIALLISICLISSSAIANSKESSNKKGVSEVAKQIPLALPVPTQESKTSPDWLVAQYTGGLLIATCGLVAVALMQLALFLWQLVLMRRSLEDAKDLANTARISADAAKAGAEATKKTVDTFIKSERPHMGIQQIFTLLNGVVPQIEFRFNNIGKTIAHVSRYRVELYLGKSLPKKRVFTHHRPWKGSVYLSSGEKGMDGKVLFDRALNADEVTKLKNKDISIFFVGYIIYSDTFTHRRERGFGFRYIYNEHRVIAAGGKTYNHDLCTEILPRDGFA